MALESNELFSTTSRVPHPRLQAEKTKPVDIQTSAGAELLPIGTPMAFDTGTNLWTQYDQAGMNGENVISGILYGEAIQLSASDEVQGTVLIVGEVDRDDINTAAIRAVLAGSPSEAQLDTALRAASLREKGIIVRNLTQVQ